MKRRIVISEDEKKDIKHLYRLNESDELFKTFIQGINQSWKELMSGKKDSSSNSTPSSSDFSNISLESVGNDWMSITKLVIDKFEGGYWNPECGHPRSGMGKSTETMFGLDRKNGGWDKTPCGQKFFGIIDKEKEKLGKTEFCNTWKWNYKGGSLENELKETAATCMKNSFDRNLNSFVHSSKAKDKILNNKGLLLHFSYATWNGPGFFQKWAKSIEKGVENGLSDNELIDLAISDRKNSALIHQDKVASLIKSAASNNIA